MRNYIAVKKFSPLFVRNENDTSGRINEFVLESGRVSGKTQHDEMAAVLELMSGRGDMWYCRSEDNTIRGSIFTSTLNTISMLGLTYSNKTGADFKVSYSPFEIKHNGTGNVIQFFGINKDINRSKGKIPPSGKLKRVMVEEANECDDGIYIDALVTTAVRFFNADSKLVFRLNPPQTKQHWSVAYFKKRIADGATKIYTTWEDLNRLGLLTPATVSEILKMKEKDEMYYRYWYLGEQTNMQGLVFPHFDSKRHVLRNIDVANVAKITRRLIIAGDAANKNDATAFGLICELQDGNLLLLDSMYYNPKTEGHQTDDVELARLVCDWYTVCMARYPGLRQLYCRGIVDNANWNLMRMLQLSDAMGWFKWTPATDKHILRDTNRLRTMFRENVLLFNGGSYTANDKIITEIENYIYDPKTGEIKNGQDDHGIDMLKYGTLIYADTKQFF